MSPSSPSPSPSLLFVLVAICTIDLVHVSDRLSSGQSLAAGNYLESANGFFFAQLGTDGNFEVFEYWQIAENVVWSSNTAGAGSGSDYTLSLDVNTLSIADGSDQSVWSPDGVTASSVTSGGYLSMQNDGDLVLYDGNNAALWSANSLRLTVVSSQPSTRSAAQSYCRSEFGTDLFTVRNQKDLDLLFSELAVLGGTELWIGLNDIDSEGIWQWEDGTCCQDCAALTFWGPGEPNDSFGDEDCATATQSISAFNDLSCDQANVWFACNRRDVSISCQPTSAPTASPIPSESPTLAPTRNCEADGFIKSMNLNVLLNAEDNLDEIPSNDISITFDDSQLSLTFEIDLELIGDSSEGLPTTYHIDFAPFRSGENVIDQPGNCANRRASDFDGVTEFSQKWGYSEYPYLDSNLGSADFLSFPPPSDLWTLSIDSCGPINYHGEFDWNQLLSCTNFEGVQLINIEDDGDSLTLSGTLYVQIVSPYLIGAESGYYNVYSLIQQDFTVAIRKQIDAISSNGVQLFVTTISGLTESRNAELFEMTVLTVSAGYIQLANPNILSSPFDDNLLNIAEVTSGSECLAASKFSCAQFFRITIPSGSCPIDFSGVYQMSFDAECRDNEPECDTFIDENGGSLVALEVTSNFEDATCDPLLYEASFDAVLQFYDDEEFVTEASGDFVVGEDMIYIQITADSDIADIAGVEIMNVFGCTADDDVDLTQDINQQSGEGGCLSADIDGDALYFIVTSSQPNDEYDAELLEADQSNVARLAFTTFDIGRTTLYIHVQLELTLPDGTRRRLVVDANFGDAAQSETEVRQIRSYVNSVDVGQPVNDTTNQYDDDESTAQKAKIQILFLCAITVFFIAANC